MPKGKGEWFTPNCVMKNKQEQWQKLEESGWQPPKMELEPEITFFNNKRATSRIPEYDLFFAYTRISPLFDPRKHRSDSLFLPDIRENIFQQEKDKPIPVLTSMNYGRPCRVFYDVVEKTFCRTHSTLDFYRTRGVMKVIEKEVA